VSLESLIAELGVVVVDGAVPVGTWGSYCALTHTITLLVGLSAIQRKCVLWHEISHALHGHVGKHADQEELANTWAARQLIRLEDYVEASACWSHIRDVARHLEVIPSMVRAFEASLTAAERMAMEVMGWRPDILEDLSA
jgi:hypothetical protein